MIASLIRYWVSAKDYTLPSANLEEGSETGFGKLRAAGESRYA